MGYGSVLPFDVLQQTNLGAVSLLAHKAPLLLDFGMNPRDVTQKTLSGLRKIAKGIFPRPTFVAFVAGGNQIEYSLIVVGISFKEQRFIIALTSLGEGFVFRLHQLVKCTNERTLLSNHLLKSGQQMSLYEFYEPDVYVQRLFNSRVLCGIQRRLRSMN